MKRHLFLIGFMGSGKTYWGERLAVAWNKPFVDLDEKIEAGEKSTIAEIFARAGEAEFRTIERRYLHQLAVHSPSIVATGGGTPCFFDNLAWMRAHGAVLFLDVPWEVLLQRLQKDAGRRPLLTHADAQAVRLLWQSRLPCYRQANDIVPFSSSSSEGIFWERLCLAAQRALEAEG